MLALGGQLLAGIVGGGVVLIPEHLSGLIDVELVKIALVLHHSLAQVGQQGGTDEPLGGGGRRGQGQDAVGALQHGVDVQLVHPRIGEDLLHAAAEGQILLDLPFQILVQLVDSAVEGGGDGRGLEVLVAVHAGHFLHDVGLDADVAGGAPCGHHHMHVVAVEGHLIAQQLQLLLHVVGGQGLAQTALQPAESHVDLRLLQMLGIQVGQAGDLHLGIQLAEQLHGHGQGLVAALGVDGLFIAGGGFGAVVVPQSGAADALGVEVGHLQNDTAGLRQDRVLGAAHDACQTHGARVVGDHQIVGAQGQLLAVQQQKLFALGGAADDDVACDVVGVEGVGGLTGSQHDVVGHVHQRVDGTHAHLPDAALHLIGRGLHIQVLNGGGHIPGAALRVLHGDGQAALTHIALVGDDGL